MEAGDTLTLLAGGDIGPIIEPTDQFAQLVLPALGEADLRFAQCERTYSTRGQSPAFSYGHTGPESRLDPRLASVWKTAGIDIVSVASNKTMEWGPEALLDTIELFRSMGMKVIGGGENIEEARAPAIVESNGVKIAFLAYCSILRPGQAAGVAKAGIAPMRARTYYARGAMPNEEFQPGTPPRVVTEPYEEDVAALQDDIRKAKQRADAVVVSLHWGLHMIPKTICDYQPPVAHAAIDAGADLILGHHAHVIKAIEVYKGKVCFYSLGNFMNTGWSKNPKSASEFNRWNLWWFRVDPECLPPKGMYLYPTDSRKTMLVKATFSRRGVERVAFLPAFINALAQPAVVQADDPRFQEVLEFTEWSSDQYPHQFRVEGDEVVVEPQAHQAS